MSKAPIEFFFDFSSPYGFLAARKIDALAAEFGREVIWKPYLMGVAMKQTQVAPLLTIPLKGEYAVRDVMRHCRHEGIEGKIPAEFPFISVAAARAFYALTGEDPQAAKDLALGNPSPSPRRSWPSPSRWATILRPWEKPWPARR